MKTKLNVKKISVIGMFCALAFCAVLLGKLVPNVAGFLSYDPKDALVVIAGFIFGPLASVIIAVIVSFIEFITISGTGPWGLLMNIISTCAFSVPAAAIYKRMRSMRGAICGLVSGVFTMAAGMMLWNYLVTPFYMGVPRAEVASMLIPVFLPFNLVKGSINLALALLLYKPIVTALRKAGFVPKGESAASFHAMYLPVLLISLLALVLLVTLYLILTGTISL